MKRNRRREVEDTPFTPEAVQDLFKQAMQPRRRYLSPEAAATLATRLNAIRYHLFIDEMAEPLNEAKGAAVAALKKARGDVAGLIGLYEANRRAAEEAYLREPDEIIAATCAALREKIETLKGLEGLIGHVQRHPELQQHFNTKPLRRFDMDGVQIDDGGRPRYWLNHAPAIYCALREAMANSGLKEPGVSNQGPVGRFLEALVPMLTGESIKAESAARELKQRLALLRKNRG